MICKSINILGFDIIIKYKYKIHNKNKVITKININTINHNQ